jgi:hypothetical protein
MEKWRSPLVEVSGLRDAMGNYQIRLASVKA